MRIARLELTDLRNLARVSLSPAPGLNLIWGANGSGKTSLLEGIHLLGLGRSFRASGARPLVKEGSQQLVVFGKLENGVAEHRIGVSKSRQGKMEIRVDGAKARSASQLAGLLPVQLITPASHVLIEGGPKERRAFLDWGLFHVEQSFFGDWKDYHRALRQRNQALKNGSPVDAVRLWDKGLAATGERISRARTEYVRRLSPVVVEFLQQLLEGPTEALELAYLPGWSQETDLQAALSGTLDRDRRYGFTSAGPHRGDLRLRWGVRPASEQLSRGQQKLVVTALKLAQMSLLKSEGGKSSVVLVDDLPAELDRTHRDRFLRLLASIGAQAFVTATERELVDLHAWPDHRVFHVEHGDISEMV